MLILENFWQYDTSLEHYIFTMTQWPMLHGECVVTQSTVDRFPYIPLCNLCFWYFMVFISQQWGASWHSLNASPSTFPHSTVGKKKNYLLPAQCEPLTEMKYYRLELNQIQMFIKRSHVKVTLVKLFGADDQQRGLWAHSVILRQTCCHQQNSE